MCLQSVSMKVMRSERRAVELQLALTGTVLHCWIRVI